MKLALTGLRQMSALTGRIFAGGLFAACALLLFAVLTALTAQPYSAATYHLFRQAEQLETAASVTLFCTAFLAAFAEERLGRR